MIALTLLALLAAGVVVAFTLATLAVVGSLLKAVVWIVLLPFRLLFGLLFLPFLLLKFVLGAVMMLVVAPIAAVAIGVAIVAIVLVL